MNLFQDALSPPPSKHGLVKTMDSTKVITYWRCSSMDRFHVYSPKRSISKQFKEDSRICKLGRVSHHRHYQCVKVHEDKKRASPFFQTLPPAGRRFPPTNVNIIRIVYRIGYVIEYVFSLRLSSIALYNILHLPRPRVRIE